MIALTTEEFSEALEGLQPQWPMAVAVSGGGDSMALLRLTHQWAEERGQKNVLTAITVDHGLRADSAAEVAQVKTWCEDLSISHVTLKWEGGKPAGNLQAEARQARYDLMVQWCERSHTKSLLVAHHLEDQAETLLLRLVRGSGVDGLSGMAAKRTLGDGPGVQLLRPLLSFSKDRLRDTLEECGQDFIEDPSNEDAKYARVQVRQLRDQLSSLGLEPQRLADTAVRLQDAREALEFYANAVFDASVSSHPTGFVRLDPEELKQAPREIGLRVLARCLSKVSGNPYRPRSEKLDRMYGRIVDGGFQGATLHGCQAAQEGDETLIFRELRAVAEPLFVADLKEGTPVWDGRFGIEFDAEWLACVQPELRIEALGETGLSLLKENGSEFRKEGLPRQALLALPAIWQGERLVSIPSLDLNFEPVTVQNGSDFEIKFNWLGMSDR
jgi:tRNA(Ile)-lysidine synthase